MDTARDENLVKELAACEKALSTVESQIRSEWLVTFQNFVKAYRDLDRKCLAALNEQLDGEFDYHALLKRVEAIIPE